MSNYERGYVRPAPAEAADTAFDAGLRAFMLGVYGKMCVGLLVSASIAWVVGNVPAVSHLLFTYLGSRPAGYTLLGLIVAFAPLAIILFSNFFMRRMTPVSSAALYWTLVVVMGASMGVLFLVYAGAMIASAFLVTAIGFAGLSLVGYTIKRDLSGLHSFLIMGAWGIVAIGVLGFFMRGLMSDPFMFYLFNIGGLVIFSGLVATQTQKLKLTYYRVRGDSASMAVLTNIGALSLFIAFINMFQFILALMGGGGSRR